MAEIESAEGFANKLCGLHWRARGFGDVAGKVDARDNATRLAAKLELLAEIRDYASRALGGNENDRVSAGVRAMQDKYRAEAQPVQREEKR